jgi:hypothetical protein
MLSSSGRPGSACSSPVVMSCATSWPSTARKTRGSSTTEGAASIELAWDAADRTSPHELPSRFGS